VVQTNNQPGALANVLTTFADTGVNLTKLQSRPIIGKAWRYKFYIDVETGGEQLKRLLEDIRANGTTVTILGEYKANPLP
jgi:chorismate mutase/prephenate dehydratase